MKMLKLKILLSVICFYILTCESTLGQENYSFFGDYLFSDGLVDQFGGPSGKKFLSKQLKNILLENAALSMKNQNIAIFEHIEKWKNSKNTTYEQTDDITLMGIKI